MKCFSKNGRITTYFVVFCHQHFTTLLGLIYVFVVSQCRTAKCRNESQTLQHRWRKIVYQQKWKVCIITVYLASSPMIPCMNYVTWFLTIPFTELVSLRVNYRVSYRYFRSFPFLRDCREIKNVGTQPVRPQINSLTS